MKRIVFRDGTGKQRTLRLGECPRVVAEAARVAVGHLVIAKRHGSVPHPDAVRWLGGIDDGLYARVAALGLCQPRERGSVVTLGHLLDRFDAAVMVKPGTHYKYRQVTAGLRECLGADTPLSSIKPADADRWRKWIADPKPDDATDADEATPPKRLARATVAKRVVIAKGVFRKAVRWGLMPSNPFADLRAGPQSNPERSAYVPFATIRAVLDACPDDQWRAVIALSRFAGLRCPSEVIGLKWGDVNWERGRLTVRSPKTAGHDGHAVRVVPIAPELRPILQDLFDGAEPGTEAVVPRLRDAGVNLRTGFERIIAKAGVKPWPRLFHNLRASCATDWVERFPNHTVAAWLGHSPVIAAKHYLQTRDAHFDLAAGIAPQAVAGAGAAGTGAESGATAGGQAEQAAANPAAHTRPRRATHKQGTAAKPEESGTLVGCGVICDPVASGKVPPEGLEPLRFPSGNTGDADSGGSKSGSTGADPHALKPADPAPPASLPQALPPAPADPDLAGVVAAWPHLPPAIRAGVLALVTAATPPASA